MTLVFLDANIYLDMYRYREMKKLLEYLIEPIKNNIFISEQTKNEVIRNRHEATLERLREDYKKKNLKIAPLPELTHLAISEKDPSLNEELKKFESTIKRL